MEVDEAFRRRLRQLIQQKYRSLDRFYLETDFSKGHLSDILRGKGSPTLATIAKLAKALDVEVRELFVFPDRSVRDRAIELLGSVRADTVRKVLRLLGQDSERH